MANPGSKSMMPSHDSVIAANGIAEGGKTTESKSVSGGDQAQNMKTGSANHLGLDS